MSENCIKHLSVKGNTTTMAGDKKPEVTASKLDLSRFKAKNELANSKQPVYDNLYGALNSGSYLSEIGKLNTQRTYPQKNLESNINKTKLKVSNHNKVSRSFETSVQQFYTGNEEDKNISLLGHKSKRDFEATSKYYQIDKQFINDSYKEGNFDSQINIIELNNHNDRKLIGLFTVKDESNKLIKSFTNALYQSLILGRKRGPTDEITEQAAEFEKTNGINHYEAVEIYSHLFLNQRAEIAQANTNLYYNIFAAALQLTSHEHELNPSAIKQLQKNKVYPLTEINAKTISFFSQYLI